MTAMDSEQLRRARREIEHPEPEPVDEEHSYLWVLDVLAGCAIALICVYVAYQVAARWVS